MDNHYKKEYTKDVKIELSPSILETADNEDVGLVAESMAVRRVPAVFSNPSKAGYYRPWRFMVAERSGVSKIFYAKTTKFRIFIDVSQFDPESVTVSDEGGVVEVVGSHDLMHDKLGQISRWMKRRYKIPPDVKLDTMTQQQRGKSNLLIQAERDLEAGLVGGKAALEEIMKGKPAESEEDENQEQE